MPTVTGITIDKRRFEDGETSGGMQDSQARRAMSASAVARPTTLAFRVGLPSEALADLELARQTLGVANHQPSALPSQVARSLEARQHASHGLAARPDLVS